MKEASALSAQDESINIRPVHARISLAYLVAAYHWLPIYYSESPRPTQKRTS